MTMTCSEFEKHLLLAESGELSTSLQPRLAAHLAHCPQCRAFQADMQALRRAACPALSDAPEGPAEPVMQSIRGAAGAHLRERNGLQSRFTQVLLAMAAGLIVLMGIWHMTARVPVERTPTDLHTARIAEWSSLLAALMETEDPDAENEEAPHAYSDLQSLARQLLILQDMSIEIPDELAEGATPAEAHQPTTLRWHNIRATISRTYG